MLSQFSSHFKLHLKKEATASYFSGLGLRQAGELNLKAAIKPQPTDHMSSNKDLKKRNQAFLGGQNSSTFYLNTIKKNAGLRAAFSSSCGGLQPLAAPVGPFGSNNRTLRVHLKMFKIHLEKLAEIHLEIFVEICLNFFLRKSI